MNLRIPVFTILITSLALSAFGFSIDNDEWNGSIMLTLFEFIMMTLLQFVTIALLYISVRFIVKKAQLLF